MAAHSSILAWRIPWTEGPGGLQSMGLQRVRHDSATKHSIEGSDLSASPFVKAVLSPLGLQNGLVGRELTLASATPV